ARWGESVLTRLRTEACILVWDSAARTGFVARDPLGFSSLFWSRSGDGIVFATELRVVLDLLPTRPAPDPVGVTHWLRREATRPELTLYQGVWQGPAGPGPAAGAEEGRGGTDWRATHARAPTWVLHDGGGQRAGRP